MVVEKEGTFEVEGKSLYTKSWLVCGPITCFVSSPVNHH